MVLAAMLASCANTGTSGTSGTTAPIVKVTPKNYKATEYLDGVLTFYIPKFHKDEANYLQTLTGSKDRVYEDEEKLGTTMEVKITGETYDLPYKESRTGDAYNHSIIDRYVAYIEEFNKDLTVEYNRSLNRITAMYSMPGESGHSITRDEALKKAQALLKSQLNSASEYEVDYENERTNDTYYFSFVRVVKGIKTNETASVAINFDGTVNAYKFGCMGAFDGVDLSGLDMDAVNGVIKEKADKIYEGYTYEITESNFTVIRKADGSFVLDFALRVDVSGNEYGDDIVKDRMSLFIYLE